MTTSLTRDKKKSCEFLNTTEKSMIISNVCLHFKMFWQLYQVFIHDEMCALYAF